MPVLTIGTLEAIEVPASPQPAGGWKRPPRKRG